MPTATCSVSTPSLIVPATQNTAPVHEFNCLYTHDIRRKSKRWQDGFLRFHTFNRRVMVFEVTRNFIGDTHWTVDEPLQEGDEVTLDRSGVLVQVADQVGRTETDLTELRKNKHKPANTHGPSSSVSVPSGGVALAIQRGEEWVRSGRSTGSFTTPRQPLQEKHRSLNSLLGGNRAPIGKTAPIVVSPYEIKQQQAKSHADEDDRRPSKRQKVGKTSGVQAVRGPERRSAMPRKSKQDTQAARPQSTVIKLGADEECDKVHTKRQRHTASGKDREDVNQANRAMLRGVRDDRPAPATKLSIQTSTTRRGMLVCMPAERPTLQADIESQQKRLDVRLAQLAARDANSSEAPKTTDTHTKPSRARQHTSSALLQVTKPSRARGDTKVVPDTDLCLDDFSDSDGTLEGFDRPRSGYRQGEAYDLFGTDTRRPASIDTAQMTLHSSPPGPRSGHTKLAEAWSQTHLAPSTSELEQALMSNSGASKRSAVARGSLQDILDVHTTSEVPCEAENQAPSFATAESSGCADLADGRKLTERSKQPVQDPWSREAFDLFKWRPPGWDEEKWCVFAV